MTNKPENRETAPKGSQQAVDDMLVRRRRNAAAEQSAAMHSEGDMPMKSKGHMLGGVILPSIKFFPGTPKVNPNFDDDVKKPGMTGIISPDGRIYEWVRRSGTTEGTEK
jgi:hypothetical protein